VFLFHQVIKSPRVNDLNNLTKEDVDLICGASKELDENLLEDSISKYRAIEAKRVLEWTARRAEVIEVFKNLNKGLNFFRRLLQKTSSLEGNEGILKGLSDNIVTEEGLKERKNILLLAEKEGNKRLIGFIHENIILHKDGLCTQTTWPVPSSQTNKKGKKCVTNVCDSYENSSGEYRKRYGENACILSIYCKVSGGTSDVAEDFRTSVADLLNYDDLSQFITASVANGGLNLEEGLDNFENAGTELYGLSLNTEDAKKWSNKICINLNTYWRNTFGLNCIEDFKTPDTNYPMSSSCP